MGLPGILALETAGLSSWPSISSAMDGMWLARFARGYTRRANSIQCLDPADDGDAPTRLHRLCDLYLLNSRDPVFRVTPLAGPRVVRALDADGWAPEDECRVLAMSLEAGTEEVGAARFYDPTDVNFLDPLAALMGADRRSRELLALLIGLIAWRNAGILLRDDNGDPLAGLLVVDAGGIATFHCVVVRDNARGKGVGRRLMQAGLQWARGAGAAFAALQVLDANTPALRLYGSMGFEEAYRYHYRRPQ